MPSGAVDPSATSQPSGSLLHHNKMSLKQHVHHFFSFSSGEQNNKINLLECVCVRMCVEECDNKVKLVKKFTTVC